MIQKYSLFLLEENVYPILGDPDFYASKDCFKLLETFDSLEEAQDNAQHIIQKTIILPSYE